MSLLLCRNRILGPYHGSLSECSDVRCEFSGMRSCLFLDAGTSMINTQEYEKEKSWVSWIQMSHAYSTTDSPSAAPSRGAVPKRSI
jgi:hypothetical protein